MKTITARLIPQAIAYRPETASWDWQVVVIDDPKTLNAWCMAGGKMAIYTGIIQKLNLTDDEIAQVMGHEIAHALAKHTAERMSVALAQQAALQIGAMLLGGDSTSSQMALQAAAVATTVGVQLPNSREQEAEADRIGIELAAKAGYDPARRTAALGEDDAGHRRQGAESDFLSTHPSSEKRMRGADRSHPADDAVLRGQVGPSGLRVQDCIEVSVLCPAGPLLDERSVRHAARYCGRGPVRVSAYPSATAWQQEKHPPHVTSTSGPTPARRRCTAPSARLLAAR